MSIYIYIIPSACRLVASQLDSSLLVLTGKSFGIIL